MWFPIVYAALGVLACTFGMAAYLPVFYIYVIFAVFAALFNDDVKVFAVPLLMTYFAIGGDGMLGTETATQDVSAFFEPAGLVQIVVCCAIIAVAFVWRLVRSGALRRSLSARGVFTFGLLALAVGFLFNGAFSPKWQPVDLAYGLLEAVGIVIVYFIALGMSDKSEGMLPYVCKVGMILGLMISAEVLALALKLHFAGELLILDDAGALVDLNKANMVLGWGVANMIAGVLVTLIPATMYVAYSAKKGSWAYFAALVMYAAVILLRARTSLVVGAVVLIAGFVVCCVGGPNRVYNRYVTLVVVGSALVACGMVLLSYGWENIPDLAARVFDFLRFDESDNGRFGRWADGISDFLSSPVFGVGFADGGVPPEHAVGNMYSNMYHDLGVEILGATGVVGAIGFVIHLKDLIKTAFSRFTPGRLLLVLVPAAVLGLSLLDNFFYYTNIQLIYGMFLALAETDLERRRRELLSRTPVVVGRKPRVVFTFVEAGMGHIVPEKAVCDVFEKKYGGVVDVVRSWPYEDTGDPDLRAVEDGFARNVRMQGRSAFYGTFCMSMNAVFGDVLSRKYVVGMLNHGYRADKKAVELLRALDADLMFTTHWASAYYIDKERGTRPYTVMLCPDAYSNGMFNVDVNDFIMTTEEGRARAVRKRMYAGGNVTVLPYPIREEAYALRGKKDEIRERLGIAKDAFVVVLADGGYGVARLVATVRALADSDVPLTVLAVCGTNSEGEKELKTLRTSDKVDLRVYGYTDEMLSLVAASDLFVGKSGANSMAEPAFFGIPAVITKCITPIEAGIRDYYVKTVGSALYVPDPVRAADTVRDFAAHPEKLAPYAARADALLPRYGAEAVADFIFEKLCTLCVKPPRLNAPEEKQPAPQAKPQPATQPAPQAKPQPATQPAPQAKPQPATQPAPQAKPQPATQPAPEAKPQPATQPAPQAKPQPATQPAPEAKPQPATQPAPQAKPQPATQPAPEAKPQPATQPAPQAKPEGEAGKKEDKKE